MAAVTIHGDSISSELGCIVLFDSKDSVERKEYISWIMFVLITCWNDNIYQQKVIFFIYKVK